MVDLVVEVSLTPYRRLILDDDGLQATSTCGPSRLYLTFLRCLIRRQPVRIYTYMSQIDGSEVQVMLIDDACESAVSG
jgi:hypothetical protein